MCGIAGMFRRAGPPLEPMALKRMCDIQRHRGPDDVGYLFVNSNEVLALTERRYAYLTPHLPNWEGDELDDWQKQGLIQVALGHRRLSILDLSGAGHQPMGTPDGRYWIVYNGELYNSPELREDLQKRGVNFKSRSDTEVLLHAWAQYGAEILPRLDGMFGFAILDRHTSTLTLARDRFGVKPLYYAITAHALVFASEIKALFASGAVTPSLHMPSMAEYLTFQNLLGSQTIYQGVELLPPGSFLQISQGTGVSPVQTYFRGYSKSPSDDPEEHFESCCDVTRERFVAAVKRQMLSDVPVGSYLSGGMDSGAIVSVGARHGERLRTFTLGMCLQGVQGVESLFDERAQAEVLSNQFQTEHYTGILRPIDLPTLIPSVTWHLDDPRVGMCYQNFHVARLAGRMVKVCLSGTGGDELFGGYPWRYAQGVNCADVDAFDNAYFRYWHRLVPPGEHDRFFEPEIRREMPGVRARFQEVMQKSSAFTAGLSLRENLLQRALAFEFHTFLQGLFVVEDRVSMAHSLEVRVPFLDNVLADHAFTMRPGWKVQMTGGQFHANTSPQTSGKWVLRRAMESLLPPSFIQQPKQGFSTPEGNWYRGPLLIYLREVLLDPSAQERPYLKRGTLTRILDEHESGACNHRLLLWSLLSLEWLQRHYFDQSATLPAAA